MVFILPKENSNACYGMYLKQLGEDKAVGVRAWLTNCQKNGACQTNAKSRPALGNSNFWTKKTEKHGSKTEKMVPGGESTEEKWFHFFSIVIKNGKK